MALWLVLPAGPAAAQRRPALEIELPPRAQLAALGPLVSARHMLARENIRELLLAGFPARFHFRVELWSEGRFLNSLERSADYYVYVRYIAIERMYEVVQVLDENPLSLGKYARVDDAESAIARKTRVSIAAVRRPRTMYYEVTLTVEVLSASDLDDVERWLKGLQPAATGRENPAGALARGIKGILTRLLGGEKSEYVVRSPTFSVP